MQTFLQIITVFVLAVIFTITPFIEFKKLSFTSKIELESSIPIKPKNRKEKRILAQLVARQDKEKAYLMYSESKRRHGVRGVFKAVRNTKDNIRALIVRWEKIING